MSIRTNSNAAPQKPKTPLIINGDDFGYSQAVNHAIIQAHREGVLTQQLFGGQRIRWRGVNLRVLPDGKLAPAK